MIYKVNGYITGPVYFDESKVADAKTQADILLESNRTQALISEASRFSICATFVDGQNTTWREIQESDPEDTVCQVFNHLTGTYTEVLSKTDAIKLNTELKEQYLTDIGLDKVEQLDSMPELLPQPISRGTQPL